MLGGLGPFEIAIIAVVVVLLFGTRRLPELGSGLGKAISNFKKGYKESDAIDVTGAADSSEKGNPEKSDSKGGD